MSQCTGATAFSSLWEAIDGCKLLTTTASEKLCIANSDMSDLKCMEVDKTSPGVAAASVTIEGSGVARVQTEAINDQLCTVYGANYGPRNASLWVADQSNNKCVESSNCTEAIFGTIHPIVDANEGPATDYTDLCTKMRHNDGTDTSKCEAGTGACAATTAKSCDTVRGGVTLEAMIDECAAAWTISEEAECLITNDISSTALSSTQCQEVEVPIVLSNVKLEGSGGADGDSTRCFVLQQAFSVNMDNDVGWKEDGSGGCTEATTCAEIDFTDNNTSTISSALNAKDVCKDLKASNTEQCEGVDGATACQKQTSTDCGSLEFDNVKQALSDCGSGTTVGPAVCGMVRDLSSPDFTVAQTRIKCEEYTNATDLESKLPQGIVTPTSVLEANKIVCLAAGQENSSLINTNAYVPNSSSTGCIPATSCDEIQWGDDTDSWAYDKTGYTMASFKSEYACSSFKIDGVACSERTDSAAQYQCGASATVEKEDCAEIEFGTIREALVGCKDSTQVNVMDGNTKCGLKKDLASADYTDANNKIMCEVYTDESTLNSNIPANIVTPTTDVDRNNIVCMAAGQSNATLTNTNAYVSDLAGTGCEEASACEQIQWSNAEEDWSYDKTGYTAATFKVAYACDTFKIGGVTCAADEIETYKCKTPVITQCASITGVSTLTGAVTECNAGSVSDSNAKECRVAVDISGANFSCEEADKATKMKAEDVTVVDDAKSNAMCAFMGSVYGADNVDAWIYKGTKCAAIVKDGSCTEVSWTDKHDVTLGFVSSWPDLCKSIAHEGYTNESGDVGNVTCVYDSEATPAPTTCSSSIAIVTGVITAFLSMLM